ncbi:MAG: ribonuclease HI [Clostridia bacterium]|nr:ribonuclease HI [Clostridia bacterium]
MIKHIEIFTDGACSGNPGPGGWGVILRFGNHQKELSGGEENTTNNRMELTACIKALEALKEKCEVTLTTDSKYVADAVNNGWAKSWKENGWKKADKKPALNPDLWERFLELLDYHDVMINWVKGHDGHPENERCDALAVAFYKNLKGN